MKRRTTDHTHSLALSLYASALSTIYNVASCHVVLEDSSTTYPDVPHHRIPLNGAGAGSARIRMMACSGPMANSNLHWAMSLSFNIASGPGLTTRLVAGLSRLDDISFLPQFVSTAKARAATQHRYCKGSYTSRVTNVTSRLTDPPPSESRPTTAKD